MSSKRADEDVVTVVLVQERVDGCPWPRRLMVMMTPSPCEIKIRRKSCWPQAPVEVEPGRPR
jgi:hypothetical protein